MAFGVSRKGEETRRVRAVGGRHRRSPPTGRGSSSRATTRSAGPPAPVASRSATSTTGTPPSTPSRSSTASGSSVPGDRARFAADGTIVDARARLDGRELRRREGVRRGGRGGDPPPPRRARRARRRPAERALRRGGRRARAAAAGRGARRRRQVREFAAESIARFKAPAPCCCATASVATRPASPTTRGPGRRRSSGP